MPIEFITIFPIVTTMIALLAFSLIFRKSDKVDKGFALNYYRLSYRRKIIRTLYSLPFILVCIVIIYILPEPDFVFRVSICIFLLILFAAQLIYNIMMWKKKEKGQDLEG